jgi:hypothetical protein
MIVMWATLTVAAALTLAPAQAGKLTLMNERVTYGKLGAPRESLKLIPGDGFVIHFDMDGIDVASDGRVQYTMGMEIADATGKKQFTQEPQDLEALNTLGGTRVPCVAVVETGLDMPPGEYTVKVLVADRKTKATQTLVKKFEVTPRDFGIVRMQLLSGPGGEAPAPPLGVVGQELVVDFATVGFERDKAKKQPSIAVEMKITDDAGKPTLAKPFSGTNSDVPDNFLSLRWVFPIKLNRPGKFTVELKATDQISKKTSKVTFPVTVLEQK